MDRKYVLVCRKVLPIEDIFALAIQLGYDFFADHPENGCIDFAADDNRGGPVYYRTGLTVKDLR